MLCQEISTKAVLDVDGQSTEQCDLFMREDEVMTLLMEDEELFDEIEMGREPSDERNAQKEEHRPHFVLDVESTPPVCYFLLHAAMSLISGQPELNPCYQPGKAASP